jgi:hypothetical protein
MLEFIRLKIPLPVLFAALGFVVFSSSDLLTGRLFSQFIQDTGTALLASGAFGSLTGVLFVWYVVRKSGAPFFSSSYQHDAFVVKQGKQSRDGRSC